MGYGSVRVTRSLWHATREIVFSELGVNYINSRPPTMVVAKEGSFKRERGREGRERDNLRLGKFFIISRHNLFTEKI